MVRCRAERGFAVARIRGSYHVMEKQLARTTVPVHGSEILKIGTLRGILRDIEMSAADFTRIW